ncbi:hypothetical protein SteCoe_22177 [Stentor coeruleus]|uniref:Uncharacterized protein n=1 Tax=Stentor coeruleus TaxID=5963 RepID=A0A1R2BN38_9CILI|nr:hypothetical protein SteCoe_22177 [Stentor coeruleus]
MERPKKQSCSCFGFLSKKDSKKVDKGTDTEAIGRMSLTNFPASLIPTDDNPFVNSSMGSTQKLVSRFPMSNTMTTSLCRTPLINNLTSSFAQNLENSIKNPDAAPNSLSRKPSLTRRSSMPDFLQNLYSAENYDNEKFSQAEEKKLFVQEIQRSSEKLGSIHRNKSSEVIRREIVQSTEASMTVNKDQGVFNIVTNKDLNAKLQKLNRKIEIQKAEEEYKKTYMIKEEEKEKVSEWNTVKFFSDNQNNKINEQKKIQEISVNDKLGIESQKKLIENAMVITEDSLELVLTPQNPKKKFQSVDDKTTKLIVETDKIEDKIETKEEIYKLKDDFQEHDKQMSILTKESIPMKLSLGILANPQSLVKPGGDKIGKKNHPSKSTPNLICPREPQKYLQIPLNLVLESPKPQGNFNLHEKPLNVVRKSSSKSPIRSVFLSENNFEPFSPVQHAIKTPTDGEKNFILKDTAMKCFEHLVSTKPTKLKPKPKLPQLNLDQLPPKPPIKLSQKSSERISNNKLKEQLLKSLEKSNNTIVVHDSINSARQILPICKNLNKSVSEKNFSTLDLILDANDNRITDEDQVSAFEISPKYCIKRLPSLKISPIKSIISIDEYSDLMSFIKTSPDISKLSEKLMIPEASIKLKKKSKLPALKPITPHYFQKKRSAPQIKNKQKMSVENL